MQFTNTGARSALSGALVTGSNMLSDIPAWKDFPRS